jgi:hypothetical protein
LVHDSLPSVRVAVFIGGFAQPSLRETAKRPYMTAYGVFLWTISLAELASKTKSATETATGFAEKLGIYALY